MLAPAIAGMVTLPAKPLSCLVKETNRAFEHADGVIKVAEGALEAIRGVRPELHTLKVICA